MATARQIEANRNNASGPHQMSEAGKQAIRANAIRHGLATRMHFVLPEEDQGLYDAILEALQTEYAPATTEEEMLVHQIAGNYWRLMRARNIETGCLKTGSDNAAREFGLPVASASGLASGAKLAIALVRSEDMFAQARRYEAAAERSYYRAIRELRTSQHHRQQQEQPAAAPTPEIRSVAQSEPAPSPLPNLAPEIRSVPQYTLADVQHIHTMSPKELDDMMEQLTAPPKLSESQLQAAKTLQAGLCQR